jgi:hypothetical protein
MPVSREGMQRSKPFDCQLINCNLKKFLFFIPCFLSLGVLAQIKLGLVGGYNYVNLSDIGRLPFGSYHFLGGYHVPISSFHAGVAMVIPLSKKWSLEPALLYFGNGTHEHSQPLTPGFLNVLEVNIHVYYLRLPVNLLYKIAMAGSWHVFAGCGLYVARGVWGNQRGQEYSYLIRGGRSPNKVVDNSVRFSNQPSSGSATTISTYDIGYSILAGIGWKNLQLRPSISNGLIKVFSQWSDPKSANCTASVSLVYILGR